MECALGRSSLEAAFRRKPGYGFGRDFCITDELKSHPISVHFSDLFLSKKTDLYAEIWNN